MLVNVIVGTQCSKVNVGIRTQKQKCDKSSKLNTGTYESGIGNYKHMYFNATENMFKMWTLTVVAIISLYECVKYLVSILSINKMRYSMLMLFGSSLFAHYYSWWMYVNYYNDNFYAQFYHQSLFTVS